MEHFRYLGQLRKEHPALRLGDTEFFQAGGGEIGIRRTWQKDMVEFYVNRNDGTWRIEVI